MDRKGLFSIGEVSKLFHISVSSLRHYENVGLLHPEYTSPDTGYRYYGTKQFEVLNTIRYLRALDMPLAEIEDFLKNKDISNIEEKLMQQKKIVLEKQQELKRIEQKINHSQDMEAPIRKLVSHRQMQIVGFPNNCFAKIRSFMVSFNSIINMVAKSYIKIII